MSDELLASKTIIQEEDPQVRPIAGVPTAVIGLVGVAERGPIDVPTLVQSPEEYKAIFGGYVAAGDLAQAIDGIYQNAPRGTQVHVVRTVHHADTSDPSTKTSAAATKNLLTDATAPSSGYALGGVVGPFDLLDTGKTLVVDVDASGNSTATFTAVAAARESGSGTFALANNDTLTVAIDGGTVQTITFVTGNFVSIAAATAAEVAAVINGQLAGASAAVTNTDKVTITSDKKGTDSTVNVTGGTANGALGFTTGATSGSGNVANVRAVTVAEVKAVVEGAVAGCTVDNVGGAVRIMSDTTGTGSSVLVAASSTADTLLGFDNATHTGLAGTAVDTLQVDAKYDGAYGNTLSVKVAAATSGEAARFNLQVLRSGALLETFANLSMDDTDSRFVETVVNDAVLGSRYITVTDLDAATPAPDDRPVNGTFGPLTGGSDGLGSLADGDFIGGAGDNGRVAMRALDTVQELSLLGIPGRATSAVHNAMLTYCETTRSGSVFAVLDCPANTSAKDAVTYVKTTAALLELSEFGAIYWPRLQVLNPSKAVFGSAANINVYPCGYVLGVYARTDALEGGVYKAPAGVDIGIVRGCLGFETDETLDEAKRDLLAPARINPITTDVGQPRYIDGHDNLKSTGNWPSVPERRGAIFIEQSVKRGLQFARHKNNDADLRATCTRTVETFLLGEMKKGAFATKDPATAFYVDFGVQLNPPAAQRAGKLTGKVGLNTNKPVKWTVLKFSQDTRAMDEAALAAPAAQHVSAHG